MTKLKTKVELAKERWRAKDNLIKCPKCGSFDVVHLTIAGEGEKFLCAKCGHEEIIDVENSKPNRRGVSLC